MGDLENALFIDDLISQYTLDDLFDRLPETVDATVQNGANPVSMSSPPDSFSSWIDEIESLLMKDDDAEDATAFESNSEELAFGLLEELITGSPEPKEASEEVVDGSSDRCSNNAFCGDQTWDVAAVNEASAEDEEGEEEADDIPSSKKRRRQLRNKDAAARSRERKKMYVKELEMKSKYLEGECRRLGRLLECFTAENQALRLGLQNGSARDGLSAKQESAVLLLESLLLGSLLWLLGLICLSSLPASTMLLEKAGRKDLPTCGLKGPRNETHSRLLLPASFAMSKRCRASRTRMKPSVIVHQVSAW